MSETQTKQSSAHIVDAVEDFVYDSASTVYNQAYRKWRTTCKAPCMYRFRENKEEHVFVAGKAVEPLSAERAEEQALTRCSGRIGIALLLFLLVGTGSNLLMIAIFRALGMDVRFDLVSFSVAGNQPLVTLILCISTLLKFGVPVLFLWYSCRLPRRVLVPVCLGGFPELIAAFGMGMIVSAVYALTSTEESVRVAQRLFEYRGSSDGFAFAVYGLFEILITSVLAELFLRGAVLPVLRQFGDGFAVACTAAAAFLFPNFLHDRICELLIGLFCGYLLLQSGSLVKCVLVRVLCTALEFALLILVYATDRMPLWQYALLLLSVGLMLLAFYANIRRDRLLLRNRRTQLSDSKKTACVLQTPSVLPWVGISLLLTLLRLFS